MATRVTSTPKATRAVRETAAPEEAPRRRRGPSVNRVTLVGRLAADPELRYTSTGIGVATLRLATNDREQAEFHDVVVWRHLAELAGSFLAKGRLVYVEGRLHGRSWEAQDGTTRRSVEVVADSLQILSPKAAEPEE